LVEREQKDQGFEMGKLDKIRNPKGCSPLFSGQIDQIDETDEIDQNN